MITLRNKPSHCKHLLYKAYFVNNQQYKISKIIDACLITFQEGNGKLICVQVTDIFSQVCVKYPSNEAFQHPDGSRVQRAAYMGVHCDNENHSSPKCRCSVSNTCHKLNTRDHYDTDTILLCKSSVVARFSIFTFSAANTLVSTRLQIT